MGVPTVFIGDDFTGASDSLARYAQSGRRTRLLIAPDQYVDGEGLDALGIATDLRAKTPAQAAHHIRQIWPAIAALDPQRIHFKICSTFDSSPQIGSIGAVAIDLAARFRPDVIAVIGGQPSLGRYLYFGNLFARGPDLKTHRIDRHPVMAHHPVTPMGESDMCRHLAAQGLAPLTLVPVEALRDPHTVAASLRDGPVIFDVIRQRDLARIAAALDRAGGRQLLIGASSVAELPTDSLGTSQPVDAAPPAHSGMLFFAGSRSSLTRDQVAAFRDGPTLQVPPDQLSSARLARECADLMSQGAAVLLTLDPDADYTMLPAALADRSVELLTAILDHHPVGYLGIAGGDTSSRICAGLGFKALDFCYQIALGVSICIGRHHDPGRDRMRLMLKGGQMGGERLFSDFVNWARMQG